MTTAELFGSPDRRWLLEYIPLQQASDKRVQAALKDALEDASKALERLDGKPGVGAAVRRAQILAARSTLMKVIDALYVVLTGIVREGQEDAAVLAARLGFEDEEEIWKIVSDDPEKALQDLEDTARRGVQAMMTRVLETEQPLSKRIYSNKALATGQLNRMINGHIVRNSSAADIAKDVKTFVNPSSPGGVSYRAKTLARTEIVNAFHAQSVNDMQNKPWIDQAQWNLSKSHGEKYDDCDRYAEQRFFAVTAIPKRPHPGCLCTVTPKVPDAETAMKNFLSGQYDPWLP